MHSSRTIEKLPTRIPGFDHVSMGGLARGHELDTIRGLFKSQ
jgi:predicted dinucleotide-binding enzyme